MRMRLPLPHACVCAQEDKVNANSIQCVNGKKSTHKQTKHTALIHACIDIYRGFVCFQLNEWANELNEEKNYMVLWLACKHETETTRTSTNIGIAWKSSNSNQNLLIKGIESIKIRTRIRVTILVFILSHCCLCERAKRYTRNERGIGSYVRALTISLNSPVAVSHTNFREEKKTEKILLPSTLSCSIAFWDWAVSF